MPPEYRIIRAAKTLGTTPWELKNVPNADYWIDWAFTCEKADNLVKAALMPKRPGSSNDTPDGGISNDDDEDD